MAGNIEKGAILKRSAGDPRCRPHISSASVGHALLLLLIGFANCAWAQQGPPDAGPAKSETLADLPDAPQTPVSQAETSPETGLPDRLGSIQGVVSSPDGAVYEGVLVALTQPGMPARSATSDNNGHFNFTDVAAGAFQLTVSSAGFATQHLSGTLLPGENYKAATMVLPVSMATSEVRVNSLTRVEVAQMEMVEEEHQRVLGVMPNFYVVYSRDAPPLNTRQKFHLAWRSSVDPIGTLIIGGVSGIQQATNSFSGYGQGAQGYAKRFGANYADNFIGTMIGGAILPSLLKQDPRYFWKGTGTVRSRVLYAIANAVVCKGDNGRRQFDYSRILGGLAAGGISNLYYPASDRSGISLTLENALLGTAESAAGNIFQEFVARRFTPKLPSP